MQASEAIPFMTLLFETYFFVFVSLTFSECDARILYLSCLFLGFSTYTSLFRFSCIISIGNHMISDAIWDKSAPENFSKANQIARTRGVSAICIL